MSIVEPNLESLFAAAIELPEDAVDVLICRECGANWAFFDEVKGLLDAQGRNLDSGWLDEPVISDSGPDLRGFLDSQVSVGPMILRPAME